MKLTFKQFLVNEAVNEIRPNAYFGVLAPVEVWKFGRERPAGYYGSSQVFQREKVKTTLEPGDEIHYLHGGVFAVKVEESESDHHEATDTFAIIITPPDNKGPFEKNYGPSGNTLQARKFSELVQKQILQPLNKNEAVKTSYPR